MSKKTFNEIQILKENMKQLLDDFSIAGSSAYIWSESDFLPIVENLSSLLDIVELQEKELKELQAKLDHIHKIN